MKDFATRKSGARAPYLCVHTCFRSVAVHRRRRAPVDVRRFSTLRARPAWHANRRSRARRDSIDVYDNEFVVRAGASGCGKSTPLRIVLALKCEIVARIRVTSGMKTDLDLLDKL